MPTQKAANILIVGCGAIGGLFASALASVAKVTAYDANTEHVRAINAQLTHTNREPPPDFINIKSMNWPVAGRSKISARTSRRTNCLHYWRTISVFADFTLSDVQR